jgi:universal stress protein A
MVIYRKLLAPVDFSQPSIDALRTVAQIARESDASVTLLHVWEPELFATAPDRALYDLKQLPQIEERIDRELERARSALSADGPLSAQTAVVPGSPATEIVRFAEQGGFDLIVMATHGRTGLAHILLGSVTERVVRNAPCAVLTLRVASNALRSSEA